MPDNNDGTVHDWSAFKDDSGQIFYHNSKTDETSWDPPPDGEPFNPVEEEKADNSGDWVEYMDEDKGEPYYYNTVTQETAWEKPEGFVDKSSSTKSPKAEEADPDETTKVEAESPEKGPDDSTTTEQVGDWVETQDDEGRTYYYNSKTEETSWDQPAGFKKEEVEKVAEKEDKGTSEVVPVKDEEEEEKQKSTEGDWTKVQDDEGQTYYYNTKTEETSWDKPEGFDDDDDDDDDKNKDTTATKGQETKEELPDAAESKSGGDWTKVEDDEGQTYYYNEKTEETSWDKPDGFDDKDKDSDVAKEQEKKEETSDVAETKDVGSWTEVQDDEGRTYYYNEKTEETSWEKPDGFDGKKKDAAGVKEDIDEAITETEERTSATEATTGGDWTEVQDDEGQTYYYNTKTEETSWDKPEGFDSETKNDDAKQEGVEQEWVETQDEEGRTYYYNTKTEETSWDKPAELESKKDSAVSPDRPKSPEPESPTKAEDDVKKGEADKESASDWTEVQDDEGRTYYYNTKTEETSWDKPEGFDAQKKDAELSPDRPRSPSEEEKGPVTSGNWVEYKDDEGRFYYYNSETQQTSWDKPADFDDAKGDASDDDEGDAEMELSPTRPQSPDDASPAPMEVEEEEEVVDPAVRRLEEAKEALSQHDAIMETGILSDLVEVVKNDDNNATNAIKALSESAHGQTAVCGLLGRWLADLKSQTSSSTNAADAAAHTKRFLKSADEIREMTQAEINRIVKERFSNTGGDNILALSRSEAAFLEDMMDSNRWRKLLIDLSASNKDSALLMYCLQSISKRGHHREIARRINQSEHFPVFNAMLASELAVIGKISVSACHDHDTSISLNELVGDLRRICTSTSYTYLYGFEVLRFQIRKAKQDSLAMAEKDRLLYTRVIRKWERLLEVLQGDMIDPSTAASTPLFRKRRLDVACTISDLHQRQRRRFYRDNAGTENGNSLPIDTQIDHSHVDDDRRKEIESATSTFLRKYCIGTHLDEPLLDKMLPKTENEYEAKFVGNLLVEYPIAIEALLGYLYKPGQRVGQSVLRKKCARLTAVAVLAAERQSLEEARKIDSKLSESESDEENLGEMLLKGSQLCEQLENMVSFIVTTDATKLNGTTTSPGEQICSLAVKCAPVSQGVAMWAREITRGGEFVSSASYASISPNIMTLVRIVYMYHPFTRDDVCTVAFQFLKHANSEVVYQTMNSLKEQSLRLLLFLCTRGEAPSVFDQLIDLLKDPGRSSLDASLIRYFISGLLEIASPPFSIPFIRSFMILLKSPASVDALKATYFDKESKNRLTAVINYLKTRTSGKLDARPMAKEDISLINSVVAIYNNL